MDLLNISPDDFDATRVSLLIMAHRELLQATKLRTALTQTVIDRINDTLIALMLALDAAIIAAS